MEAGFLPGGLELAKANEQLTFSILGCIDARMSPIRAQIARSDSCISP